MSTRSLAAAALALALASPVAAQPSPAPSVTVDVFEISATAGKDAAMDADLKPLEKKLKKPPFSSWNQFHVLMKSSQALTRRKSTPIKLKIGAATVTLVEIVEKSKCRLTVTIDDDKGKQIVNNTSTVEGGDHLVYGHSLANNDGHLLALTCK